MDSGSGSLQSSSGGDDDYDSHHHHHHHHHHQQQQQPHLFPPPPPPLFFNATIPPPPPPHQPLPFHLSPHNFQNLYDFPSNFNLQPTNFNPDSSNSFLNLDDVRPNPTSLRSEPTTTTFKTPTSAEGSTHTQIPNRSINPSPSGLHPKPTTKKRTRASRRAPTTVLTTDTTNFRAMVQEFTGIPSPPFTAPGSSSSSSSSFSRRFDLFASVRANTTTTTNLEASGSGFHPSKVHLFSSLNNNNNVTMDDQTASRVQQAGIFSFQSLSEGTHLEPPQIHGSSTSQELLSALQNDEAYGTTTTTATTTATTANCKLKFTGSSSSSNNLQQTLLGNIVATTTTSRGERTVESWICPSD